jgi:hypothetical protein
MDTTPRVIASPAAGPPAGASGARPDLVMICGQGRSGTNWLLKILDQSPHTHCRNEPNDMPGSPLSKLPSPFVPGGADAEARLAAGWDAAARFAATHVGEFDHALPGPKDHVYGFARVTGLTRSINPRPRKLFKLLAPSLGKCEFPLPFWVGSNRRLAAALGVLKFVQAPVWACWLLEHRPNVQVLHIVRHPGGFLHSWKNRWLKLNDPDAVRRANRDRLDAVRRARPEWAPLFGDIDAMGVVESELWYWRFASEAIHAAGEGKPRYELVVYERLAANTLDIARPLYDRCGLPWDDDVAARVRASSEESGSIAAAWRTKLPPEDVAAIDKVMAGSLMASWWPR